MENKKKRDFGFIGYIVIFFGVVFICYTVYDFFQKDDYVTNDKFEKSHKYLNQRIDTVIDNQTEINRKLDSVISVIGNIDKNQAMQILKTDSILASQKMLHYEITGKNNWAKQLLEWLE